MSLQSFDRFPRLEVLKKALAGMNCYIWWSGVHLERIQHSEIIEFKIRNKTYNIQASFLCTGFIELYDFF